VTMENKGDAITYPVYTILGPMNQPIYITNSVTGATIRLDKNLTFAQGILVDTQARTVYTVNRSSGSYTNRFIYPSWETSTVATGMTASSGCNLKRAPLSGTAAPLTPTDGSSTLFVERSPNNVENAIGGTNTTAFPTGSVAPGDILTCAFDHMTYQTISSPQGISVYFQWKNSGGTNFSTYVYNSPGGAHSIPTAWKRLVAVSTAAPANTVACDIVVQFKTPHGNGNLGYWMDRMVMEKGATDGSYFDGDTPRVAGHMSGWDGTADASTSQSYTTTYDVSSIPVPSYSSVNFADTTWHGLNPGNNSIQVEFTPNGVGGVMRADWRNAWL